MTTTPLARATTPLVADVIDDDITAAAILPFDLDPATPKHFYPWLPPDTMPDDWGIGMIVGASGSGKSQLLARFGTPASPSWTPRHSIASHFPDAATATDRFYAVGLSSVPVWRLPYEVLSNGQQFRADLARALDTGAVIDEFTSVVDRNVAVSASRAMSAHIARHGVRRVVLAGVHRDVIPWVRPDWIIDTDAGTFTIGETIDRPRWYGEFIKGDGPVGRIVLA